MTEKKVHSNVDLVKAHFNTNTEDERSLIKKYQYRHGKKAGIDYIQKQAEKEGYTDFKLAYAYHLVLKNDFDKAKAIYHSIIASNQKITEDERVKAHYFLFLHSLYRVVQQPENAKTNDKEIKKLFENIPESSRYRQLVLELLSKISNDFKVSNEHLISSTINKQQRNAASVNISFTIDKEDHNKERLIRNYLAVSQNKAWEAYKLVRFYFDNSRLTNEQCLEAFDCLLQTESLDSHLREKLHLHSFYLYWERYKETENKSYLDSMLNSPLEQPAILKIKNIINKVKSETESQTKQELQDMYPPLKLPAIINNILVGIPKVLGILVGAVCDLFTLGTISLIDKYETVLTGERAALIGTNTATQRVKDFYGEEVDSHSGASIFLQGKAAFYTLLPTHPQYGFTSMGKKMGEWMGTRISQTINNFLSFWGKSEREKKIKQAEEGYFSKKLAINLRAEIDLKYVEVLKSQPANSRAAVKVSADARTEAKQRKYGKIPSLLFSNQTNNNKQPSEVYISSSQNSQVNPNP